MPKPLDSGSAAPRRLENVACPFCALLCDDLSLSASGDVLSVSKNGCAQAKLGFERPRSTAHSTVDGKRASQKEAVAAAVRLLKRARRPLISGLGTDVEGMREAIHLAEKSKAVLDHANSKGFDSGVRVLQSRGWYLTTLAELKNRADLVIVVGVDLVNHYTNFIRRYVAPEQTLHPQRRQQRRVVYLGEAAAAPAATKTIDIEQIACDPTRLAEVLSVLRARAAGRGLQAARVAKAHIQELKGLAQAIKAAEYTVFVWAPGHLAGGAGDLTIHAVTRLIDDLNKTQRAAGLVLGGDNGLMSAVNVCTWLTGHPLHVSFAAKTLEYDPIRYRTQRLLEEDEVDVLVWIDAFGNAPPAAISPQVKRIVIGLPGTELAASADIFIPTGTPGVDHGGRLIRTDSVVSLRMDQLRHQSAPSIRMVVHDILEHY